MVKKNDTAWMDAELFSEWITKELIPYVTKRRNLLQNPDARALFVVEELCAKNKIDLIFVPPGTTSIVQPLDLTLNKK